MPHPLISHPVIDQSPGEFLRSIGNVFAEFGAQTQDSGNVSYGVQVGGERYFVKTAGEAGDTRPLLDHPARVALLRNVARLGASVTHRLLPGLLEVIESPGGPLLVYPWLDGELLGVPRSQRDDPRSAFQRFRSLPLPALYASIDGVLDLHAILSGAGWVASDFYDGSLLYDFEAARLWVVDLDMYRDAPFRNDRGRMPGSTRFMAPEEFEKGALIDERTTVFVMGRATLVFLSDGTLDFESFRGPRSVFDVVAQACRPDPVQRFASMTAFSHAWQAARGV